jgi:hypothetical protein
VAGVKAFARRVDGEYGEQTVDLAGGTIRTVAMGVVVTALAQAVFAGVGLAIAQVPVAAVLTLAMFALCVAQIGPIPILAPVVIWAFTSNRLVSRDRAHQLLPPAAAAREGGAPSRARDARRRHRWAAVVREHRAVRGAGALGGDLHLAEGVGHREGDDATASRR